MVDSPELKPWQQKVVGLAMAAHERGERFIFFPPNVRPDWSVVRDELKRLGYFDVR